MTNYKQALELLQSGRNPNDKPIGNNTRLVRRGDVIAVRLHETDVVLFSPTGAITLSSGGWKTPTTKARINEYSPFQVSQERGSWFVQIYGARVPFADGMIISAKGKVKGAGRADSPKWETKLRKECGNYARSFVDALYAGKIAAPGNGDCWHCLMQTDDGKSLGEATKNSDHIKSHIEEQYFVPSLLVRALKTFGASVAATQTAHAFMQGKLEYAFDKNRDSFLASQIQKCVRRYCLRQFELAS